MRTLTINDNRIPLLEKQAIELIKDDILYECGESDHGHDLHINPLISFNVEQVEKICLAIVSDQTPWR
jgi:hypothetical protein